MEKPMRGLTAVAIILLMTMGSGQAQVVDRQALLRDIAGKWFQFATAAGERGIIRFSRNGSVRIARSNFNPSSDQGRWWFSGADLCARWTVIRDGQSACSQLSKVGEGRYRNTRGDAMRATR